MNNAVDEIDFLCTVQCACRFDVREHLLRSSVFVTMS